MEIIDKFIPPVSIGNNIAKVKKPNSGIWKRIDWTLLILKNCPGNKIDNIVNATIIIIIKIRLLRIPESFKFTP